MTPITRDGLIKEGFGEGTIYFIKANSSPYFEISVDVRDDSYDVCVEGDSVLWFPNCKTIEQLKALWEMLGGD